VRAEDHILGPEVVAHPDGDGFLTDVRVAGPVHQPALMGAGELLLTLADDDHLPVKAPSRVRRGGFRHSLVGRWDRGRGR
jgi:hypothetical protein